MFYTLSALAYVGGALWVTRPLLWYFSSAIPIGTTPEPPLVPQYMTADSHQLVFYAWLFAHNLRNGLSAFANTLEMAPFNPSGMHPMGSWSFPIQPLWWALTALGMTSAAAYNMLVLVSYPLTGLSTAFCLRRLGASKVAAFAGGLVYAFCVFRQVQVLVGHANGFLLWLVPWLVLALVKWLERPSYGWAVLLGGVLLMMALGEWHLFYYAALFVAAVSGVALVIHRREVLARSLTLAPAALLALAGVAWLRYTQSFGLDQSTIAGGRTAAEAMRFTLLPLDLVVPWVRFTRDVLFSHEVERRSSYVGLSTIAIIAIGWRGRNHATPLGNHARFFLYTALIALLLAFSAVLPPIYGALKLLIPYWGMVRVKGRLLFLVMFGLAGLVAWALDRMRGTWQRLAVAAAIADFVLVSPPALMSRGPFIDSPVLARAAEGDGPLLVIPYLPPDDASSTAAQRLAMVTRRPMLNGYEPIAPAAAFEAAGAGPVCAMLSRYNVRDVLRDRDVIYGPRYTIASPLPERDFRVVAEDQHYTLYESRCDQSR